MTSIESTNSTGTDHSLWSAPSATGPIVGTVRVPGSKSITNRALVLAAHCDEPVVIRNALVSRDSQLMVDALVALGIMISAPDEHTIVVTPGPLHGNVSLDCGLSGTVMRFLPPLAALADGPVTFRGDEQAKARPMGPTLDALRQLQVPVIAADSGSLPLTVATSGRVGGPDVVIDAHESSQFISGLLLSAPRFPNGIRLHHRGPAVPSLPHIEMTVDMLRGAGATIETHTDDLTDAAWSVQPSRLNLGTLTIEPDLSNAAAFLAAAMVTGGSVTIPDWPAQTTQAGQAIVDIFTAMGATSHYRDSSFTLRGPQTIRGLTMDLGQTGELVPTIAAVCCFADSPSRLSGIGHLRGHETDRLAALVTEINKLGGRAREFADGIDIDPAQLTAGIVESYHDHRMATFGAITGLRICGLRVTNISSTSKTMPDFPVLWDELVTGVASN